MKFHQLCLFTLTLGLLTCTGCGTDDAGLDTAVKTGDANDPAAVFTRYTDAVELGDANAVLGMLAAAPVRPDYPGCSSEFSNRACLFLYLNDTVITRHTGFTMKQVDLVNDVVMAHVEVRSDLTRFMTVDRIVGVDQVQVVDNKIKSLVFAADFQDAQTARFFKALGISPPDAP